MDLNTRKDYRRRRHFRIRKKIRGTTQRPRMSVFISNQHMYIQFIDDLGQKTLASMSTLNKEFKEKGSKSNIEGAHLIGVLAAQAAKEKGIFSVVFDRGGFSYNGRIKVIAEAARKEGIEV